MIQLFNTILYQPFFNLLVFLYNIIPGHDVGIAIIVMTILIKFLLLPLTRKGIRSQKALQQLQPKIDQIRKKFKDDRERQSKELMKFYQENKINPLSSCLPLLIQMPIIIALFRVFRTGLGDFDPSLLYPYVSNPGSINPMFLGLVDLSVRNLTLAILAGLFQFIHSKTVMGKQKTTAKGMAGMMSKQMTYFMPLFTVFIGMSLPSGLMLYWIISTLFAIGEHSIIMRKKGK